MARANLPQAARRHLSLTAHADFGHIVSFSSGPRRIRSKARVGSPNGWESSQIDINSYLSFNPNKVEESTRDWERRATSQTWNKYDMPFPRIVSAALL